MGKVWQEKIDGRWRSVKACDACGHVMRSARKSCPVCLHVERLVYSDPRSDGLAVVHVDDSGVALQVVPENRADWACCFGTSANTHCMKRDNCTRMALQRLARVFDLGEIRPARLVQGNPFRAPVEPEFTARHFRIALGVCGTIALLGYAWAWWCA